MNRFIKNSLILLGILVVIGVLSHKLNQFLFKKEVYHVPSSCHIIITGDSFVLNGINPKLINNSCNIAMLAEPTILSYFKIKHILSNNKHIKKVVIPFSPTYFKPRYDRLFKDYWLAEEFFKRVSGITSSSDFKTLNMDKMKYFEWYSRYRFLPNTDYLLLYFGKKDNNRLPYVGEFFMLKEVSRGYDYEAEVLNLYGCPVKLSGKDNVNYLDSIALVTSNANIDLYIVGMPLHKELYNILPSEVTNYCDHKISQVKLQYNNVQFIDCYDLINNEDFANLYHLRESGSFILTNYIKQVVCN